MNYDDKITRLLAAAEDYARLAMESLTLRRIDFGDTTQDTLTKLREDLRVLFLFPNLNDGDRCYLSSLRYIRATAEKTGSLPAAMQVDFEVLKRLVQANGLMEHLTEVQRQILHREFFSVAFSPAPS